MHWNSASKNKNHSLLVYQGFTVRSAVYPRPPSPRERTFGYVNPWLSAGLLHLTVEYSCVEGMTISFLSKDRRVRKPRSLHITKASRDVIESAQTDLKEPSKNIYQSSSDGQPIRTSRSGLPEPVPVLQPHRNNSRVKNQA